MHIRHQNAAGIYIVPFRITTELLSAEKQLWWPYLKLQHLCKHASDYNYVERSNI